MKATEIVEKLRNVLLLSTEEAPVAEKIQQEEVNAIEVNEAEEVSLAEDSSEEEVVDQPMEDKEEMKYATKEELESALAEMRAMYSELMERLGSDAEMEKDVPEELSAEEPAEVEKEELSAESAEPINHYPEAIEEDKKLNFFKSARPRNTMSVVYEKMFNK